MRRSREQCGHRGAADDGLQLLGSRKFEIGIRAAQVRKGIPNLLARLAVRQHSGDFKLRMTGVRCAKDA